MKNFCGQFTGILISILNRYFILTAGHCLAEVRTDTLHFGIASGANVPYKPKYILRSDYRYDAEKCMDWGYIEISDSDAGTLKAQNKSFLPPAKLVVLTRSEVEERISASLMVGYPAANTQHLPADQGLGIRPTCVLLSNSSGRTETKVEVSKLEMPNTESHVQLIDYGGDPNDVRAADGQQTSPIPSMKGASGGGFWSADFSGPIDDWDAAKLKLVGIHVGEADLDSDFRGFRTILLGHHLRFIAERIPNLSEYIYSLWPGIKDNPWSL